MKPVPYPAPSFTLCDSTGVAASLRDYAGKWLIVYFYPKDDTPGCTIEACSVRDSFADITTRHAEIIGISHDDASSHERFRAAHALNFRLLSDPDYAVTKAYGAWGKKMFGQEGILRRTYIINPEGLVVKVFGRVTPAGHGEQIVRELERLQTTVAG